MSWHFSRALVEAYLQDISSDGAQSALSNTNHAPLLYSSSDRMMEFCRRSRFGMTCELLTESLGEDVLTWFLEVFLAPTSAPQDVAPELQAKRPASGKKWHGSFAKFDPATSSWKIPHCLPLVGSMSFSATWPRWGSMRNGACMAQPMPEPRTKGTGSGLWPSPKSRDGQPEGFSAGMRRDSPNLSTVVRAPDLWPTPTVHGDYNRKGLSKNSGDGLATAVKLYPTPTSSNTKAVHMRGADRGKKREARSYFPTPCAQDAKNSTLPISQRDRDSIPGYLLSNGESPGGQLNPDWVEWLMGWPIGWTSLGPLNPEAFRAWQREFRIESDGSSVSATAKFRRAL